MSASPERIHDPRAIRSGRRKGTDAPNVAGP